MDLLVNILVEIFALRVRCERLDEVERRVRTVRVIVVHSARADAHMELLPRVRKVRVWLHEWQRRRQA